MILSASTRILLISTLFMMHFSTLQSSLKFTPRGSLQRFAESLLKAPINTSMTAQDPASPESLSNEPQSLEQAQLSEPLTQAEPTSTTDTAPQAPTMAATNPTLVAAPANPDQPASMATGQYCTDAEQHALPPSIVLTEPLPQKHVPLTNSSLNPDAQPQMPEAGSCATPQQNSLPLTETTSTVTTQAPLLLQASTITREDSFQEELDKLKKRNLELEELMAKNSLPIYAHPTMTKPESDVSDPHTPSMNQLMAKLEYLEAELKASEQRRIAEEKLAQKHSQLQSSKSPQQVAPDFVTILDNQPTIPETSSFDALDDQSHQSVPPATSSKQLGTDYAEPVLPPQKEKKYAWGDVHTFRTDEAYVLGLIEHGTYDLAYTGNTESQADPKLSGRNSNGLRNLIQALTLQASKHRKAQYDLLTTQREERDTATAKALLLLAAINAHPHPKKIDAATLVEFFSRIQEERDKNKGLLVTYIEEALAVDNLLKMQLQALRTAHLTGDTALPISPRKKLEQFTVDVLQGPLK